MFIFHYIQILC